jgi:hypothetical protein
MSGHLPANRLDLPVRSLHCLLASDRTFDPDREENSAQTAFAHSRNINRPIGVPHSQIEIAIDEPLRRIRMRVYDQRAKMQFPSFLGDFHLRIKREQ